jgi:rod shape-determining protein MreC
MFQSIVNFVAKFKEFITFTALVVISLSLIASGKLAELGGFRTTVIVATAWLQEGFSWIPNPGALRNENRALRELNLQLSQEVMKMRNSVIENDRLHKLLDFKIKSPDVVISAEVVGRNSIEMRNYMTIDKGSNQGIELGMAVRTDAGLVGLVIGTSANYSMVELILNRNVKISGTIQRTGINGIFSWNGGQFFNLKNIPGSFDVKKGDIIMTSNYSNKYPSNIPLGEIIEIKEDKSSLFQKLLIKSSVNLESVEQVFVVKTIPDPERRKLLLDMETFLKTKKKAE